MLIKDKGKVTSYRASIDQAEVALLDQSSWTYTISNKFKNEQASLTIELREEELLPMLLVAWILRILIVLLVFSNQSIKIDVWC